MSIEFFRSNNNLIRACELKKNDKFSIAMSALDFTTLTMIFNQQIVPTEIKDVKVPIKKWLPFIKKKVKYIDFTFVG